MSKIIEVPLTIGNGEEVGKVKIDEQGRLKIEMKTWLSSKDMHFVLFFLHGLNQSMSNFNYTNQIAGPVSQRRGHN